jgi:2-polyprenyl-3-methyl-5-hydroxy-6-metoxy-1,4-benzoquinol methylase
MFNIYVYLFLLASTFSFCFCGKYTSKESYQPSDPTAYTTGNSFEKFLGWTNEKQKTAEAIERLIPEETNSLLDIGAGDGQLTKLLEKHFNHVFALEPSPLLFTKLKEKLESVNNTIINLPIEEFESDETFDVILASHVFQYIKNPSESILKIQSMLKDSGVLLVVFNEEEGTFEKLKAHYKKYMVDESLIGSHKNNSQQKNSILRTLLESHFSVTETSFTSNVEIPSVKDFISILDFIYDTDFQNIPVEYITNMSKELYTTYGSQSLKFSFKFGIYACRKNIV